MPSTETAVREFAARLRRWADNNPVYSRFGSRDPVDERTRERCTDILLMVPVSIRASLLRLPHGDSLTIEFLDGESMHPVGPVKALADTFVAVVFAGAEPERSEPPNPPWTYWMPFRRAA